MYFAYNKEVAHIDFYRAFENSIRRETLIQIMIEVAKRYDYYEWEIIKID